MRRILGSLMAVVVLGAIATTGSSLTAPTRAGADGTWGSIVDGVPEAIVVVGRDREIVRWDPGRSGGVRWTCGYHRIDAPVHSVYDPSPVVDWTAPVDPEPGRDYMFGCFVDDGVQGRTLVRSRYVTYDPGDPFSGVAVVERTLDEARRRLEIPDPDPVVNPPGEQLAGLPMWLWLERPWVRLWTTASIGDTWASVVAFPIMSHWTFSDGADVWCDRGVAWDVGRSPREQSSACTHTWHRSSAWSAGGVEWVTVTMVWKVEWYASDIGGQPLGTVERSTTFPVRVAEAQAVVR